MENEREYSDSVEYCQQGKELYMQKKMEEALAYFIKGMEADKRNIENYFGKGLCLSALERYEDATEVFLLSAKIDKKNPYSYLQIANVETMQGKVEEAIRHYHQAIALGYEDDGRVFYSLALIYHQLGRNNEAISNYSKAIAKEPLNSEFYLSKVDLFLEQKKYEEAIQTLEELSRYCPDVYEGYGVRVTLLCQKGKYAEAEKVVEQAINLFPKDVAFLVDKAKIENCKGNPKGALEILQRAGTMEGWQREKRSLCLELAKSYAKMDEPMNTIRVLEEALEAEGDTIDAEVRFFLTTIYVAQSIPEKVLEHASVLSEKMQDSSFARTSLYLKGGALKQLGRQEEAEKVYQEASSFYRIISIQEPGNVDIYLLRALCLKEIKKYEEAVGILNYLLIMCPEMPEIQDTLEQVYCAMGNTKQETN